MIFTLIIRSHPLKQGSQSAYFFAKMLYEKKHQIAGVFFYRDGVYHAQEMTLPIDEINLPKKWLSLAQTYHFKLNACVTACEKRGISNESFFPISGLGQLSSYLLESDRVIEF